MGWNRPNPCGVGVPEMHRRHLRHNERSCPHPQVTRMGLDLALDVFPVPRPVDEAG